MVLSYSTDGGTTFTSGETRMATASTPVSSIASGWTRPTAARSLQSASRFRTPPELSATPAGIPRSPGSPTTRFGPRRT
jgi:hypothetical protein